MPWRGGVGRRSLSAGPRPGGRRGSPPWSGPAVGESQPSAGYPLENGGNVGRPPWRAVRRVEAVVEGMLGDSIVHVQEEKGFELVHPTGGGPADFRQCSSAQLCLLAFTKKALMLSFQTGSSLSSSPLDLPPAFQARSLWFQWHWVLQDPGRLVGPNLMACF